MPCDRSGPDGPAPRRPACGARLALVLIEDDSGARARFLDVIAAEPSLRVTSGTCATVEMLAWLGARLGDALRADASEPDRPSLSFPGRRAGTLEATSITEITLCTDESSMLRAFEAELSEHLMKDSPEARRTFRVLSLHAGGSSERSIVAREILVGRKAAFPASAIRGSAVPKHNAGRKTSCPASRESLHFSLARDRAGSVPT